jgi:hypothetical protein
VRRRKKKEKIDMNTPRGAIRLTWEAVEGGGKQHVIRTSTSLSHDPGTGEATSEMRQPLPHRKRFDRSRRFPSTHGDFLLS